VAFSKKEDKMETRHVKLNHGEALDAKKQLLSSEMSMLQIIKRMRNYKLLRKKEFTNRNHLKTNISAVRTKINLIFSTFPEEEKVSKIIRMDSKKISKEEKDGKESRSLQRELEDIQRKLRQLE
jgi:hypothetical protein